MNAKPWYLSRTVWVAVLQAVLGVLAVVIAENPELGIVGALAVIKSAIDMILRGITTRPIN